MQSDSSIFPQFSKLKIISVLLLLFGGLAFGVPSVDESILESANYLEVGDFTYLSRPGTTLSLDAPVSIIPRDKSLGEFSNRRPPISSVPGLRLGYGLMNDSNFIVEGSLSLGGIWLNEDPFDHVNRFSFEGRRAGAGLALAQRWEDLTISLALSEQLNWTKVRGGLIMDEILSSLNSYSETRALTTQVKYDRILIFGSLLAKQGKIDFRVFDQGANIAIIQKKDPYMAAGLGYQEDSYRINFQKNFLANLTEFYQITYSHSWGWR